MGRVALIATMAYPYDGRSLRTGDRFEASEPDAELLKLIGKAREAPLRPTPSPRIQTRTLSAESESDTDESPDAPKPKRQYRRRDLTPEV